MTFWLEMFVTGNCLSKSGCISVPVNALSECLKSWKLKFHAVDHIVSFSVQHFTQYIPLNFYELESCLGNPSIYVFDCSAAGMIVNAFCDVCAYFRPYWNFYSGIWITRPTLCDILVLL